MSRGGRSAAGTMATPGSPLVTAVTVVLRARPYPYFAVAVFLPALALYLVALPATYTGGAVGLISLRYLNGALVFFSFALAVLLSLVLTLNTYGFRASLRQRGTSLSLGGLLASLVPSSVCCTSLVPSLLAAVGASTSQIFGLTGRIQGTVARHELLFLALALVLLLLSLQLAARNILGACHLLEGRVTSDGPVEDIPR